MLISLEEALLCRLVTTGPGSIIIRAEEIYLDSIFSNRIINARDALEGHGTNREKTIKVEIAREDTQTGVSVAD